MGGLAARDDLPAVHPRLDELEGQVPPDRLGLLGQPHRPEPALAEPFKEPVGTDDGAGGGGAAIKPPARRPLHRHGELALDFPAGNGSGPAQEAGRTRRSGEARGHGLTALHAEDSVRGLGGTRGVRLGRGHR